MFHAAIIWFYTSVLIVRIIINPVGRERVDNHAIVVSSGLPDIMPEDHNSQQKSVSMNEQDGFWMKEALAQAQQSLSEGGIPIGSILVYRGQIIGQGYNQRTQKGSAILHAEMDALEQAGRQHALVYSESTLYTTLSPCAMCSGAVLLYQIPRVVIGENQNFMGEENLLRERGVVVDVLQDKECINLMSTFIRGNPELWQEDIGK